MIDHASPTIEVEKPWGKFEQYTHNVLSTVKVITVDSGGSLQYHHWRDELWVMLDEGAEVQLGDTVIRPQAGERIFIPRTTVHRLSAAGDRPVRILEISFGEFDENDIFRLDDLYGRLYKAMVRGNGAQKAVDMPRESFVTMRSDPKPQPLAPKETHLDPHIAKAWMNMSER